MKEEFLSFTLLLGISWVVMKEEFLRLEFSSTPTRTYATPSLYWSFVLYLPAEGKTPSPARGTCDVQPLPSVGPYDAAAKPRQSPVPPKLRSFNQLI